jgi:hypothetical protein
MKALQILAVTGGGYDYYFTGIFGAVIVIAGIVLIVCWIALPFIIITKFNDLIREVRALRGEVRGQKTETEHRDAKVPPTLEEKKAVPRQSEATTAPDIYRID